MRGGADTPSPALQATHLGAPSSRCQGSSSGPVADDRPDAIPELRLVCEHLPQRRVLVGADEHDPAQERALGTASPSATPKHQRDDENRRPRPRRRLRSSATLTPRTGQPFAGGETPARAPWRDGPRRLRGRRAHTRDQVQPGSVACADGDDHGRGRAQGRRSQAIALAENTGAVHARREPPRPRSRGSDGGVPECSTPWARRPARARRGIARQGSKGANVRGSHLVGEPRSCCSPGVARACLRRCHATFPHRTRSRRIPHLRLEGPNKRAKSSAR